MLEFGWNAQQWTSVSGTGSGLGWNGLKRPEYTVVVGPHGLFYRFTRPEEMVVYLIFDSSFRVVGGHEWDELSVEWNAFKIFFEILNSIRDKTSSRRSKKPRENSVLFPWFFSDFRSTFSYIQPFSFLFHFSWNLHKLIFFLNVQSIKYSFSCHLLADFLASIQFLNNVVTKS